MSSNGHATPTEITALVLEKDIPAKMQSHWQNDFGHLLFLPQPTFSHFLWTVIWISSVAAILSLLSSHVLWIGLMTIPAPRLGEWLWSKMTGIPRPWPWKWFRDEHSIQLRLERVKPRTCIQTLLSWIWIWKDTYPILLLPSAREWGQHERQKVKKTANPWTFQ